MKKLLVIGLTVLLGATHIKSITPEEIANNFPKPPLQELLTESDILFSSIPRKFFRLPPRTHLVEFKRVLQCFVEEANQCLHFPDKNSRCHAAQEFLAEASQDYIFWQSENQKKLQRASDRIARNMEKLEKLQNENTITE